MYYTVVPRCAISSYPKGRSDHLIDSFSGMWYTCPVPVITSHVTTKMPRCQAKMRKSMLTLPPSFTLPPSVSQRNPPLSLSIQTYHLILSSPLALSIQLACTSFQFRILFPFQGDLLPVSLRFLPIFLFSFFYSFVPLSHYDTLPSILYHTLCSRLHHSYM